MLTIVFEDNGQDFLEWDVDQSGEVIACRPFQEQVWKGMHVENVRTLVDEGRVLIRWKDGTMRYILHYIQEVRQCQKTSGASN